jgi:hypothetical protein
MLPQKLFFELNRRRFQLKIKVKYCGFRLEVNFEILRGQDCVIFGIRLLLSLLDIRLTHIHRYMLKSTYWAMCFFYSYL